MSARVAGIRPSASATVAVLVVVCLFGLPGAGADAGDEPVAWVWAGGITSRSAVIKARVAPETARIRLLLGTGVRLTDPRPVPAAGYARPDDDGIVTFRVDGLEAGTRYDYLVETGGTPRLRGRFRTFPEGPASFRVALASCATTGSDSDVFATIRRLDPLLFIHMGDFHYEDIEDNDPAAFRRAYEEVLGSRGQGALFRNVPIAYVWDDHDYGGDDSDGTSSSRPAALRTYGQVVPHYPLSRVDGRVQTIQQAFTAGRVRFLITDVRAARSPKSVADGPDKSMLGAEQRRWLFRELEAARGRYPLVVWVNVVPWITRANPGGDEGWEPYGYERRLIADRIEELGLTRRLVMLSGDAHMVAIDDGSNTDYTTDGAADGRSFPVLHAAPLDRYPRVKGGPYSHGTHAPKRLFGVIKISQFGMMEVRDDGGALSVVLTGRNDDGDVLEGMSLRLRCDGDGCSPVEGIGPPGG